ncbi:MAG TPA: hypothetical protein EYN67_14115 [Flavobacteriales bacterium]|nr:hypothetical protein [Flavobacteriales bacterium]
MESIGSFAEALILRDIEEVKEGKDSSFNSVGISAEADMPDISKIDINSNQVNSLLLGENIAPELVEPSVVEEEYSTVGHSVTYTKPEESEDPIAVLLERLSYLVEKAESLVSRLDEMTAAGSVGTSQKFNLMQDEPAAPPPLPKVMNKLKRLKKYARRR